MADQDNEPFVPTSQPGVLHQYSKHLTAFEHILPNQDPSMYKPHTLMFIDGKLNDKIFGVSYVRDLVETLGPTKWSVFSVTLSSSYELGLIPESMRADSAYRIVPHHHDRSDTPNEIDEFVKYVSWHKKRTLPWNAFRGKRKIVLMSHSFASESVFNSEPTWTLPGIDGFILQSPVEEFEATSLKFNPRGSRSRESFNNAHDWVLKNKDADFIPENLSALFSGESPLCAERFANAWSHYRGAFFPSHEDPVDPNLLYYHLCNINCLDANICVIYSELDEHMPAWVDKKKLLGAWKNSFRANDD